MKKTIYAKNGDGKMQGISSSGWEVEETVTRQALDDIQEHIKEAYEEVKSGKKSTLYYYMFAKKMDLLLLAQATGFFQWTIKKDFNPKQFANIKQTRLEEYCDVLGVSQKEIRELPNG
jgi:5'-deoxynucleotidase YfbR-like HD superfamily hydrolase